MKILQVHKYFSKQRGGGSVTAFFEIIKALKKKEHQVSVFAMQDDTNYKSEFSKYFSSHFDVNSDLNFFDKIRLAFKAIYNREAGKKIELLIKKEQPEIAHLHNIDYYLGSSIIDVLKKNKVPIVMTLHNYKLICPNYKLFNKGEICEKCKGGKYYNCFLGRCMKNSWSVSFVAMIEAYFNKFFRKYEKIDYFIAPSYFMKKRCETFGIASEKIRVIRNPFDFKEFEKKTSKTKEKDYFLYFGRLSEEKGISDLIMAVASLKKEKNLKDNILKIVGHGPAESELKKMVEKLKLGKEVQFLGFKKGLALREIIQGAKFVVVPSVWYDNSPMVIVETQFLEKPIIVSDFGGSKESIVDGETGLTFKGGDIEDLKEKIKLILDINIDERREMGKKGRENIGKIFSENIAYNKLIEIYKKAIEKK